MLIACALLKGDEMATGMDGLLAITRGAKLAFSWSYARRQEDMGDPCPVVIRDERDLATSECRVERSDFDVHVRLSWLGGWS
jgi:hypothetical protein